MRGKGQPLSRYEVAIVIVVSTVSIPTAMVVAPRLDSGVGWGMGLSAAMLILWCVWPAGKEVTREMPPGTAWKDLKEPYWSQFRRLVIRHLAACWTYAVVSLMVVALLFVDRVKLGIALTRLASVTLALFIVNVTIRRSLRKVWAQVENDHNRLSDD